MNFFFFFKIATMQVFLRPLPALNFHCLDRRNFWFFKKEWTLIDCSSVVYLVTAHSLSRTPSFYLYLLISLVCLNKTLRIYYIPSRKATLTFSFLAFENLDGVWSPTVKFNSSCVFKQARVCLKVLCKHIESFAKRLIDWWVQLFADNF